MQTSATSSTGHDTIDPRYDTTRSTPAMCCRTYRRLKPQQSSQRAEHARYVNGHSCAGEHFLLIFQPKWAAMYA
jgi:hypothetical protein